MELNLSRYYIEACPQYLRDVFPNLERVEVNWNGEIMEGIKTPANCKMLEPLDILHWQTGEVKLDITVRHTTYGYNYCRDASIANANVFYQMNGEIYHAKIEKLRISALFYPGMAKLTHSAELEPMPYPHSGGERKQR